MIHTIPLPVKWISEDGVWKVKIGRSVVWKVLSLMCRESNFLKRCSDRLIFIVLTNIYVSFTKQFPLLCEWNIWQCKRFMLVSTWGLDCVSDWQATDFASSTNGHLVCFVSPYGVQLNETEAWDKDESCDTKHTVKHLITCLVQLNKQPKYCKTWAEEMC